MTGKTKMKKTPYEGLQDKIKALKAPRIDVFKNVYPARDYVVKMEIPEFTSICPKTGLPDFATITISYIPGKWCVELKSLKYYTIFYRDVGIFSENAVNKILDDLVEASGPRWMEVVGEFNARGGIRTVVTAEYGRENSSVVSR